MDAKRIIIIGSGLAGVFLSARLSLRGHQVLLVDAGPQNRASHIAAGLYNIVTGKKAVKTWMAEILLAELYAFFKLPSFQHLQPHLHKMEIYRPFKTVFEVNEWFAKSGEPEFLETVSANPEPRLLEQIHNPMGGLEIHRCGRADTNRLLPGILDVLENQYGLTRITAHFDYTTFVPGKGNVVINGQNQSYDELVFCEGIGIKKNPFFSTLPIIPLKGQLLDVEIPDYDPGFVLSRKVFVIPTQEGPFLVGSTYERKFEVTTPTAEGRAEIEQHLQALLKVPYKVVGHRSGIRPTTPSRCPMLGTHPEYEHIHVFNGLGSKGWLHAPYFSGLMANFLEGDKNSLTKDVNITRYLR